MSHKKSNNTSIEILLRKALWHGKDCHTDITAKQNQG